MNSLTIHTPSATADSIQAILTDAASLGIVLQSTGDKLQFKPQQAMTPSLKQRIQTHKPALLAYLSNNQSLTSVLTSPPDKTPSPSTHNSHDSQIPRVLSVLSVSSSPSPSPTPKGVWSQDELALLRDADFTPDRLANDMPLVTALKDTFASWPGGLVLVSLEPDPAIQQQPATTTTSTKPHPPPTQRQQAAHLLRLARQIDQQTAINLRDAWHERLAICTISGGQSITQAMTIALNQLKTILP